MSELTDPQSDAFEDIFFELLGKYKVFSKPFIDECTLEAHLKCGGEYGDESREYGYMLVRENRNIRKYDSWNFEWLK